MPTYDYDCPRCGVFAALRPIAARNAALACPSCALDAARIIVAAPVLASLSTAARGAHATNERAAHEPRRSSGHGSGCGCCGPLRFPRAPETPAATRTAGGRPWMISH
ncbi:MAG: zinc ribbon domain-containing protein [Janthinobacterium lividum]